MDSSAHAWFVRALACHQLREGMGDAFLDWDTEDWLGADIIADVRNPPRPRVTVRPRAGRGWWRCLHPWCPARFGEGR